MTKKTLRQQLSSFFSNHEITQWFDPLIVEFNQEKKQLTVTFPHIFFERWFKNSKQQGFENQVRLLFVDAEILYKTAGLSLFRQKNDTISLYSIAEYTKNGTVRKERLLSATKRKSEKQITPLSTHTFESFLTNKKNDFPYAAAKEMAFSPHSLPYWPFVIFGESGCGKTHLLGAMAQFLKKNRADIPFFYGTPASLLAEEKEHLENTTVFFIDDIQQMTGDTVQQSYFIYFLDQLHSKGAALALCMDIYPQENAGLIKKLRMRLAAGLVVELKKPDLDIRHRYIQKKNSRLGQIIPKDAILSIAQRYQDFRLIDGVLNKIQSYLEFTKDKNKDIMGIINAMSDEKLITPHTIINNVALFHGVAVEDIISKSRNRKIANARQYSLYLCRDLLGLPLIQLGHFFGGMDHSSVLYSINKIKKNKDSNKDINNTISQLKNMCLFHSQ